MLKRKITITNSSGLHMRPAGVFAKTLMQFKSSVLFEVRGREYIGKSMVSVLSAAVKCGDEIELHISGADAQECMDAIVAAIESGLGES